MAPLPTCPNRVTGERLLRDMSPEQVPPHALYTIRNLRVDAGELDIDFVLHGVTGPRHTLGQPGQGG